MLWYIRFLPGWSGAEIKFDTVDVALPKQSLNLFQLVQAKVILFNDSYRDRYKDEVPVH